MTKKILVNLWEPLIDVLKEKMDNACMKRDAYLDRVLRHEASILDKEIGRNSDDARSYISEHLGKLKKKQVNLLLSEETVAVISEACDRTNTPRDAFVNRVILFLVKLDENAFMEKLYPYIHIKDIWLDFLEACSDEKYTLFQMGTLDSITHIIQHDPFWRMRTIIEISMEKDDIIPLLHKAFIKKDFFNNPEKIQSALGFNCFIEDDEIEGSVAYEKRLEESKRFLDVF